MIKGVFVRIVTFGHPVLHNFCSFCCYIICHTQVFGTPALYLGGPGFTLEKFILSQDKLICFLLRKVFVLCQPSGHSCPNLVILFKYVMADILLHLWKQLIILQCQFSAVCGMIQFCSYKITVHGNLFFDDLRICFSSGQVLLGEIHHDL